MGFLKDTLFGSKRPASPLDSWGRFGPRITQKFITGQQRYDEKERARIKGSMLQQVKKSAAADAASRGLGKSTIAMAIQPSMQLDASIGETPHHYYDYMRGKARYGALEPWSSYRSPGGRAGGLFGTIASGVGGYFGGPLGASIGGSLANSFGNRF